MSSKMKTAATTAQIVQSIVWVRGHKVLIDADLANLYGVDTRVLVQAVKRNKERFPEDFMFQLSAEELNILRSQIGDGSIYSVERMTIASDFGSQTNQGGCPQEDGCRVRAGTAAAEHFPQKPAHGFDGVGGSRQAQIWVCEVRTVELQCAQEFSDRRLHSLGSAVAVRQAAEPLESSGQGRPIGQFQGGADELVNFLADRSTAERVANAAA